ncbi:RNA-protein complex protein Nop10 [Picrophilus oshimae]|uniref:Ribosome biogenesis protein Nop10 n=1 Tax=Picrophilus torridus (strain ATCC 700027 / DSM 9790 / JCM 10055 / NBRC 100828 / KAW 2/3) TaxID=1122961 RepID=A0A8G2FWE8_PICTO|nr:RNA-protein complex protein Nop10 [Picrophilus oshimae]SMD30709.1 H/ACA ribonucleoprotein complex subunit 3 [Picrophilus oshimae DSM 9789]
MKSLIRRCPSCNIYTLKEYCPRCSARTCMAIPVRFSPADKFQRYRLMEESDNYGKDSD